MYDMIWSMIDHTYTTGDTMQQFIIYTCCVIICILVIAFTDAVRTVFSRYMYAGKK